MATRAFFVYILASPSRVLYVGVTGNLLKRLAEHRAGIKSGFASRHGTSRLVYFEITSDPLVAIAREKQLKGWKRIRKLALIEAVNPEFKELSP